MSRRTVLDALSRLSRGGSRRADILLTDDETIAGLAGRYRGSRGPTDVLAFGYEDDRELAGEIAISVETAARQARERGVRIEDEIILLCIHGLLHIGGQGDETRGDWCRMRELEFDALARAL